MYPRPCRTHERDAKMTDNLQGQNEEQQPDRASRYWKDEIDEILKRADFGGGRVDSEPREPNDAELRAANLIERAAEGVAEIAADQARWAMEALRLAAVVGFEEMVSDHGGALRMLRAAMFLRSILVMEVLAARRQLDDWHETTKLRGEVDELIKGTDELLREIDEDFAPKPQTEEEAEAERVADREWDAERRGVERQIGLLDALIESVNTLYRRICELNPRACERFEDAG